MPDYKMTPEYQKILTEMIGEKFHKYIMHNEHYLICSCGQKAELGSDFSDKHIKLSNRTFTTDTDMMKVFRWLVDNGKWASFSSYAMDVGLQDKTSPDFVTICFESWLFYDSERFCCLVAMAKKEGVI